MQLQPNILFITAHGLGCYLGCYGQRTVTSPNLDALAEEGFRFANHFCSAPQCSPSRAAMATGRFPHANGMMGLAHRGWELHAGEKHIAALLGAVGYQTAGLGVLHESDSPALHGFATCRPSALPANELAEDAVRFLRKDRDPTLPFYLQVGFFEPHRPFDFGDCSPDEKKGVALPPYLVDEDSARSEFAGFQGAIRQLDAGVGRILRALAEAGLEQETLVVFVTDHGIPFPRAKCAVYDAGLETALLVRWPARGWSGGQVFDEMLSNADLFPTTLQTAGLPVPGNLHGRSFASLCDGGPYQPREEVFAEMTYHLYYDPRRCIRTASHKLIVNFATAPFFMDPSQSWRPGTITVDPANPAAAKHPPIELYDLREDPLETRNLADTPEEAPTRDRLLARLRRWMQETEDPLLHGPVAGPLHHAAVRALSTAGKQRA